MLLYGKPIRGGVNLGTRRTFADISATVLEYLGVPQCETAGNSFLPFTAKKREEGELLLRKAAEARNKSYAPYSGFQVGAALLAKDGTLYTAGNIENAAYTPTICAERTALFHAVSDGKRSFKAIAVIGGKSGSEPGFCAPCGVCRQALSEFCDPEMPVYLGTAEDISVHTLGELLPLSFGAADLAR